MRGNGPRRVIRRAVTLLDADAAACSGGDQAISPEQWDAIKATVILLNGAEAQQADLPDWFFGFRDQLSELVVAATPPIKAFEVTEHFCYLLDMYVAGASLQDVIGDGTQEVLKWAAQTLRNASLMGIQPNQNGDKSVWLVVHPLEGKP